MQECELKDILMARESLKQAALYCGEYIGKPYYALGVEINSALRLAEKLVADSMYKELTGVEAIPLYFDTDSDEYEDSI